MLNKQRKNEAAIRRNGKSSSRDWLRINTFLWIRRCQTDTKRMDTNGREERTRGRRPTAQGVPRDTGRPGALDEKNYQK